MRFKIVETIDRGFFAPQSVGASRHLTPEGYLVCVGVPIARTGTQLYHEKELGDAGIEGDERHVIRVHRTPEEVFRPESIASYEGKPITLEHPPEFVNPSNRKKYEVGHMQHIRRGEGDEADLLLADLCIKDPTVIAHVNTALPEVSSGYDASYRQDQRGQAVQQNIVANHLAIVSRGRAGSRVAIRDSILPKGKVMTTRDAMLSAIEKGKLVELGLVWTGSLEPRLDTLQTELKDLVTPLTIPNTLTAESPGAITDLGDTWTGDLKAKFGRVADALQALERAVAEAKGAKSQCTRDSAARLAAGFGTAPTPAEINDMSRRFYDKAPVTPIAVSKCTTYRELTTAMNKQAQEFYSDKCDKGAA